MKTKFKVWNLEDKNWHPYLNDLAIRANGDLVTAVADKNLDTVSDEFIPVFYSGLLDKNGKEIYEGDIGRRHMIYTFEGKPAYHYDDWIVEFHSGSFLTVKIGEKLNPYSQRFDEIEIIGNIYENPDLLNKEL